MLDTSDIRKQLINEYLAGNIKDTGYDCENGDKYVEVRNVIFEVDKPCIFDEIVIENKRMDENWYIRSYDPRIENQFSSLIERIVENPNTRQAVLVLAQQDELETPGYVCTIYMHVFLDKKNDNEYDVEYSVHMRSNDSIDFVTDVQWHNKIFNRIMKELKEKTNWKLNRRNIIWNVDSIQLYSQYFDKIKIQ